VTPRQYQYLTMGLLVIAAVLAQTLLAARLPLPGPPVGIALAMVIAIGLAGGSTPGAVAGFSAGLLLDIFPPAATTLGVSALAFLIAGTLAGRVPDPRGLAPAQVAGLLAGIAALTWLLVQALFWLLGDPVAPASWLLWFVAGVTLVGLALTPAVAWLLRRFVPGRRARRRPAVPTG